MLVMFGRRVGKLTSHKVVGPQQVVQMAISVLSNELHTTRSAWHECTRSKEGEECFAHMKLPVCVKDVSMCWKPQPPYAKGIVGNRGLIKVTTNSRRGTVPGLRKLMQEGLQGRLGNFVDKANTPQGHCNCTWCNCTWLLSYSAHSMSTLFEAWPCQQHWCYSSMRQSAAMHFEADVNILAHSCPGFSPTHC